MPVARLPKPETLRIRVVITHWRVAVRRAVKVEVDKLFEVRPDNLVGVDEDDLLEVHREEHVEEEDLICPDDALLLRLCT